MRGMLLNTRTHSSYIPVIPPLFPLSPKNDFCYWSEATIIHPRMCRMALTPDYSYLHLTKYSFRSSAPCSLLMAFPVCVQPHKGTGTHFQCVAFQGGNEIHHAPSPGLSRGWWLNPWPLHSGNKNGYLVPHMHMVNVHCIYKQGDVILFRG